jgi:hypothetical protein
VGTISPIEQKSIEFYGETLIALRDTQGTIWLPVRRLCEAIGVTIQGQLSKINDDPVMREQIAPFPVTLPDGRTYEMECLSLRFVRAWLFSVNANRVRPQVRDKLIQYQREVIEIIDRHFSRPGPTGMDERIMEAMRDNALQQAKLWEVMIEEQRRLRAAEELLQEMDDRLGDHDRQLDDHAHALNELRSLQSQQSLLLTRFNDAIRLLPAPSDVITPAQKSVIKELVDDVVAAAQEKGIRLGHGRNDYPAVWAALKLRFEVAKYDELTVAQFDACVTWLKQWKTRLVTT